MKKLVNFMLISAFILVIPVGLWLLKSTQPLKIAIIDKSAVEDSYSKHLGVNWTLNYMKVQTTRNKSFDPARDYYGGFTNVEGKGISELRPLPEDYLKTDIIYLANTATTDEIKQKDMDPLLAVYEKTHGGLSEVEWQRMLKRLNTKQPSMFIAEFDSFSTPTSEKVQTRVADRLGVMFSGWKGIYVDELDPEKNKEVQKVFSEPKTTWDSNGPGFLLVNDSTREVLGLQLDKEVSGEGIHIQFTDLAQEGLNVSGSHPFHSWFDIVTAEKGETLATYEWDLTTKGTQKLMEKGIPTQFDAVIRKMHLKKRI